MNNKLYVGHRGPNGCEVSVDGMPLPLRTDLCNHSPDGFNWGYCGSGPAQLALAILSDFFGPCREREALERYQEFKNDIVSAFPQNGWELTGDFIDEWLYKKGLENERRN